MSTINTGITTSFNNTPQAGDDLFTSTATGITEDSTGTFTLDVMANDLGGKAKTLYSLDNGVEDQGSATSNDLLVKDTVGTIQYSKMGAEIRLTAEGKVSYHITPGMNLQSLAAGEQATDSFTYAIRLASGALSWATAYVQIMGVNDAPTVTALSSSINEGAGSVTVDALEGADDVDNGAVLSVVAPADLPAGVSYDADTHSFTLDANNAAYDSLAEGETQEVTVNYGVSDGLATTPNTITFTVTGTNDAPTVTALAAAATEGAGSSTVDALEGADDVDNPEDLSVVVPDELPAGVSYDADTHSFTLDANNAAYDSLAEGETQEVTVNYGVCDGLATTANTATFTVTGVNDIAVIGGNAEGSVTEDSGATLNAAGALTVSDADHDQSVFVAQSNAAGTYGSFSLDAAGNWTYSADNSQAAIQNLGDGETLTDSFTAYSVDGSASQLITVTLNGVDEPIIDIDGPTFTPNADNDNDSLPSGTTATTNNINLDNTLIGTSTNNTINGQSGNDSIFGLGGSDTLIGGSGNDTIYGGTSGDTITADAGNDTVYGGSGADTVDGGGNNDTIWGGSGDDILVGGNNNDTIYGGSGIDSITGGSGVDTMTGDGDADTFYFGAGSTSTGANADTITGFDDTVDTIDLSAIDADSVTSGDQAFNYAGSDSNTVANSLTWSEGGGNTTIHMDTNGDTTADMEIVLTGTGLGLAEGDFIL